MNWQRQASTPPNPKRGTYLQDVYCPWYACFLLDAYPSTGIIFGTLGKADCHFFSRTSGANPPLFSSLWGGGRGGLEAGGLNCARRVAGSGTSQSFGEYRALLHSRRQFPRRLARQTSSAFLA